MSMKIFYLTNTNNKSQIILSKNETNARKIFHKFKYVKNVSNAKCLDITEEYINTTSSRGFDLSEFKKEGLLYEDQGVKKNLTLGQKSHWEIIS